MMGDEFFCKQTGHWVSAAEIGTSELSAASDPTTNPGTSQNMDPNSHPNSQVQVPRQDELQYAAQLLGISLGAAEVLAHRRMKQEAVASTDPPRSTSSKHDGTDSDSSRTRRVRKDSESKGRTVSGSSSGRKEKKVREDQDRSRPSRSRSPPRIKLEFDQSSRDSKASGSKYGRSKRSRSGSKDKPVHGSLKSKGSRSRSPLGSRNDVSQPSKRHAGSPKRRSKRSRSRSQSREKAKPSGYTKSQKPATKSPSRNQKIKSSKFKAVRSRSRSPSPKYKPKLSKQSKKSPVRKNFKVSVRRQSQSPPVRGQQMTHGEDSARGRSPNRKGNHGYLQKGYLPQRVENNKYKQGTKILLRKGVEVKSESRSVRSRSRSNSTEKQGHNRPKKIKNFIHGNNKGTGSKYVTKKLPIRSPIRKGIRKQSRSRSRSRSFERYPRVLARRSKSNSPTRRRKSSPRERIPSYKRQRSFSRSPSRRSPVRSPRNKLNHYPSRNAMRQRYTPSPKRRLRRSFSRSVSRDRPGSSWNRQGTRSRSQSFSDDSYESPSYRFERSRSLTDLRQRLQRNLLRVKRDGFSSEDSFGDSPLYRPGRVRNPSDTRSDYSSSRSGSFDSYGYGWGSPVFLNSRSSSRSSSGDGYRSYSRSLSRERRATRSPFRPRHSRSRSISRGRLRKVRRSRRSISRSVSSEKGKQGTNSKGERKISPSKETHRLGHDNLKPKYRKSNSRSPTRKMKGKVKNVKKEKKAKSRSVSGESHKTTGKEHNRDRSKEKADSSTSKHSEQVSKSNKVKSGDIAKAIKSIRQNIDNLQSTPGGDNHDNVNKASPSTALVPQRSINNSDKDLSMQKTSTEDSQKKTNQEKLMETLHRLQELEQQQQAQDDELRRVKEALLKKQTMTEATETAKPVKIKKEKPDPENADITEQSPNANPKPTDPKQPLATTSQHPPSQNSTDATEPHPESNSNQHDSRQQDPAAAQMHPGMFFQPGMGQWVMHPGGMVVWQPFNQPAMQQVQAMYMQQDGSMGQWQQTTAPTSDHQQSDQSSGQPVPMFYQQMAASGSQQKPTDQYGGQPVPMFSQQMSPNGPQGSSTGHQWGATGAIPQPHSPATSRPSSRPTSSEYPPLPPSVDATDKPPLPDSTPPPAPSDTTSPKKTKTRQLSGQSTASSNDGQRHQSTRHPHKSSSITSTDHLSTGRSSSGNRKLRKQSSERSEDLDVKKEPSDYKDGTSVQKSKQRKEHHDDKSHKKKNHKEQGEDHKKDKHAQQPSKLKREPSSESSHDHAQEEKRHRKDSSPSKRQVNNNEPSHQDRNTKRTGYHDLFIVGLCRTLTRNDLFDYFQHYGQIHNITIPKGKYFPYQRYCFIRFSTNGAVESIIREGKMMMSAHGEKIQHCIKGKYLICEIAGAKPSEQNKAIADIRNQDCQPSDTHHEAKRNEEKPGVSSCEQSKQDKESSRNCRIHISRLGKDISNGHLIKHFGRYGHINQLKRPAMGFAFITFKTEHAVEAAIEDGKVDSYGDTFVHFLWKDRTIECKRRSQSKGDIINCQLFVSDLVQVINNKNLHEYFGQFGEILGIDRPKKSYCFITFSNPSAVDKILEIGKIIGQGGRSWHSIKDRYIECQRKVKRHKYLMRRKLMGKESNSEDDEAKTNDNVLADIKQERKDGSQDETESDTYCYFCSTPLHSTKTCAFLKEQRKKLIKWATKRDRSPSQSRSERSDPATKRSRKETGGDYGVKSESHGADGTREGLGDGDMNRTGDLDSKEDQDRSPTGKKEFSQNVGSEVSPRDKTTGNNKIRTFSTKHKHKLYKNPLCKRDKLPKSRGSNKERPQVKRCKYFKMRGHKLSKCVLCKNMNLGALQVGSPGLRNSNVRSPDKKTARSHSRISTNQSADKGSSKVLESEDAPPLEEDEFYPYSGEEWVMDSDVDIDDDWYEEADYFDEDWDSDCNRLWIIGDNLLNGAQVQAMETQKEYFGLPQESTEVYWFCSRGATLMNFTGNFQRWLQTNPPPTYIIIHLGTNDMATFDEEVNFLNVNRALKLMREMVPDCVILWSEVIPRLCVNKGISSENMALKRASLNQYAITAIHETSNSFVIRHTFDYYKLFREGESLHLTVLGLDKLLRMCRMALQKVLKPGHGKCFPSCEGHDKSDLQCMYCSSLKHTKKDCKDWKNVHCKLYNTTANEEKGTPPHQQTNKVKSQRADKVQKEHGGEACQQRPSISKEVTTRGTSETKAQYPEAMKRTTDNKKEPSNDRSTFNRYMNTSDLKQTTSGGETRPFWKGADNAFARKGTPERGVALASTYISACNLNSDAGIGLEDKHGAAKSNASLDSTAFGSTFKTKFDTYFANQSITDSSSATITKQMSSNTKPTFLSTKPSSYNTNPSSSDSKPGSHISKPSYHNTKPSLEKPGTSVTNPSISSTKPSLPDTKPSSSNSNDTKPFSSITYPSSSNANTFSENKPSFHNTKPSSPDNEPSSHNTKQSLPEQGISDKPTDMNRKPSLFWGAEKTDLDKKTSSITYKKLLIDGSESQLQNDKTPLTSPLSKTCIEQIETFYKSSISTDINHNTRAIEKEMNNLNQVSQLSEQDVYQKQSSSAISLTGELVTSNHGDVSRDKNELCNQTNAGLSSKIELGGVEETHVAETEICSKTVNSIAEIAETSTNKVVAEGDVVENIDMGNLQYDKSDMNKMNFVEERHEATETEISNGDFDKERLYGQNMPTNKTPHIVGEAETSLVVSSQQEDTQLYDPNSSTDVTGVVYIEDKLIESLEVACCVTIAGDNTSSADGGVTEDGSVIPLNGGEVDMKEFSETDTIMTTEVKDRISEGNQDDQPDGMEKMLGNKLSQQESGDKTQK